MEGGTLRLVESEEELRSIGAVDDDLEGIEEETVGPSEEGPGSLPGASRNASAESGSSAAGKRETSAQVVGTSSSEESVGSIAEVGRGLVKNTGAGNMHSERESANAAADAQVSSGAEGASIELATIGGVDENAEAEAQALTSASGGPVTSAEVGAGERDGNTAEGATSLGNGNEQQGTSGARGQQNEVKQGLKSGQTVVKEDRVEGVVTRETVRAYITAGGGYLMFTTVMVVFLIAQVSFVIVYPRKLLQTFQSCCGLPPMHKQVSALLWERCL